ncbi:MAG TPA: S-adenosylmethionine:tRNA ribosyltransferase-isomerase [Acidimicrobiales bacterium]|nr:S-adenosylmethionine:tRNA ribosyltransferase-isomerase [Acidimicrobiales bacterium]
MTDTGVASGISGRVASLGAADGPERAGRRLLVAWRGDERLEHATFSDLGSYLRAGDVVVVNTSQTLPAAVPAESSGQHGLLVHLSSELADGRWVIELRRRCGAGSVPFDEGRLGQHVHLSGGGRLVLDDTYPGGNRLPSRLWAASLDLPGGVLGFLARAGRPIRYGSAEQPWPLAAYQTIFARHPGSAEMPSAGRGFTHELVTDLVVRGVLVVPVTLHAGVSSQEIGEPPYPERYEVPAPTAEVINDAHRRGSRVVAVGTTVTRALESAAESAGVVRPARGWTELIVTPERGVQVVDGLVTGWHEPTASHLQLLHAVAGLPLLERSYAAAAEAGYLGHEFGDFHLMLP